MKHHETQDNDGTVLAATDTFYRGTNRILQVSTYKKAHGLYSIGGGWRIYYMGNQPVLLEDHKTPGGDVTLRVYGKTADLSDFEEFTRHPDGSVQPASTAELGKLKEQSDEGKAAAEALVGIVEHSMNTHTNVTDVVNDLKQKAEQLKRPQGKRTDEDTK